MFNKKTVTTALLAIGFISSQAFAGPGFVVVEKKTAVVQVAINDLSGFMCHQGTPGGFNGSYINFKYSVFPSEYTQGLSDYPLTSQISFDGEMQNDCTDTLNAIASEIAASHGQITATVEREVEDQTYWYSSIGQAPYTCNLMRHYSLKVKIFGRKFVTNGQKYLGQLDVSACQ